MPSWFIFEAVYWCANWTQLYTINAMYLYATRCSSRADVKLAIFSQRRLATTTFSRSPERTPIISVTTKSTCEVTHNGIMYWSIWSTYWWRRPFVTAKWWGTSLKAGKQDIVKWPAEDDIPYCSDSTSPTIGSESTRSKEWHYIWEQRFGHVWTWPCVVVENIAITCFNQSGYSERCI